MNMTLRWGRVSHAAGYAQPTKTAISEKTCSAAKCIFVQNDAGTEVSDWHKSDTTETRFVPGTNLTKENAANLAGSSGAKDVVEGVCSCGDYIASFPILATHWGALV
jgi:O-glycosyl hydrolase